MSKQVKRLFAGFRPTHYTLTIDPDREKMTLSGTVTIHGQKAGRPSRRLVFHQHGLTVSNATIVRIDKKGAREDVPVIRINHQKTFDEVRLHTDVLLYPGMY